MAEGLVDYVRKISIPVVSSSVLFAGTAALGLATAYTDAAIIVLVGGGFILRELVGFSKYKGKETITGKTVIVTGSNTGIGLETAKDLAGRGGRIILACRDMAKCEAAAQKIREETNSKNVLCMKLDLASFESIREFADKFNKSEPRLDILINNAGVMMCPKMLTKDRLEMQMGTNHFGHFLLTNLLLEKLKASQPSRIINVSSSAHKMIKGINFEDINSEKAYSSMEVYAQSKLANILHAKELARRLEGTGVTVYALHPGVVNTELPRFFRLATNPVSSFLFAPLKYYFFKTPSEGAQTTLRCALDPALETVSGKFYGDCKEKAPKKTAEDETAAQRLWDISEEIVKGKKKQ